MKSIILSLMLVSMLFGQSVNISWNPNSEDDLAGYKVYQGKQSRDYDTLFTIVGFDTSFRIEGFSEPALYYFSVTAYDTVNNESYYSNEDSLRIALLKGDYTLDNEVDFSDMREFDNKFGSHEESVLYDAFFDFNKDSKINFLDMVAFDKCMGTKLEDSE